MKAVIYARVSTDGQSDDGGSLDIQIDACRKLAAGKGYQVVSEFRETWTGFQYRERKLLSQMRRMIREGDVDVVIVYRFDRLSRSEEHFTVLLDEWSTMA